MNSHVREALGLNGPIGALLAVAYYVAYTWGPLLISGPLIKSCGYRPAFMLGLFLIAIGSFCFAWAAKKQSFLLLTLGMHISGLGVSTLERGANPYVVNVGPTVSRTTRILFAQSMAGVGTVVAPLVARVMLYGNNTAAVTARGGRPDLAKTIELYNVVGFVTLGLTALYGLLFFRTAWVPEVPVDSSPAYTYGWRFWKHEIFSMRYARLWTGCMSNFFNIACQVTIAQFFIDYLEIVGHQSKAMATTYLSVAQALFVVGRLMSFGLVYIPGVKPRVVLLSYVTSVIGVSIVCVFTSDKAAIAFACIAMLAESPSFPLAFDSATVGLGPWASIGETMMIISICGGAVGPPLFGILKDVPTIGVSKSWSLIAAFFGIVWIFPFLCNLVPSWRKAVDLEQPNISEVEIQRSVTGEKDEQVSEREVIEESS